MKTLHKPQPALFRAATATLLGFLAIGTAFVAAQPVLAQESGAGDPLLVNPLAGDGTSDPFSSRGSGQMNGLFDLIHRANFGSGRSLSDFRQDQQESIDSAASDFRSRQQMLLQQQSPSEATVPAATPVNPAAPY